MQRECVSMQEAWRRRHLELLTQRLGQLLHVHAQSPIVPIIVGDEATAVAASAALLLQGFHVPAIRPPTVPVGTSRSLMLPQLIPKVKWKSWHALPFIPPTPKSHMLTASASPFSAVTSPAGLLCPEHVLEHAECALHQVL